MMVQQEFGNASLKLSSAEGAEPEASSPSYNDAGPAGAGKEIILIVEDDFLIAMEAENALADAGFRVSGVAATAEQALALAKKERPSVVVMDIRLAGARDGIDAAGDLYRELGLRCLFATANDDPATRVRAEPFTPIGWLAKPYTMGSLVALVRHAVGKPD
jgi:DNA-binding NarL/FixJ family response regulator